MLFYTTGPHRGNFRTLFHLSKARPLTPHIWEVSASPSWPRGPVNNGLLGSSLSETLPGADRKKHMGTLWLGFGYPFIFWILERWGMAWHKAVWGVDVTWAHAEGCLSDMQISAPSCPHAGQRVWSRVCRIMAVNEKMNPPFLEYLPFPGPPRTVYGVHTILTQQWLSGSQSLFNSPGTTCGQHPVTPWVFKLMLKLQCVTFPRKLGT